MAELFEFPDHFYVPPEHTRESGEYGLSDALVDVLVGEAMTTDDIDFTKPKIRAAIEAGRARARLTHPAQTKTASESVGGNVIQFPLNLS